jgi:putative intracellular protease/amidase
MAAAAHRALIVATAAATFPDSDTPAGCFAEELAAPYNAWTSAGYDVDIATIGGSIISWGARRTMRERLAARLQAASVGCDACVAMH